MGSNIDPMHTCLLANGAIRKHAIQLGPSEKRREKFESDCPDVLMSSEKRMLKR